MNSGIYKIHNIYTNDFYIGSTINFKNRFKQHKSKLKYNNHFNNHLQRAFSKYGEENFKFEIIEECIPEKCIEREQWYLDNFKPIYNKRIIAESNSLLKHTEETKKKKSEISRKIQSSKEYRSNMRDIIKSSEAHKKYVKKLKEDGKKGIHKTYDRTNYVKPVLQFDKKGNFIKEWPSTSCFEVTNKKKTRSSVSSCCTGRLKTAYGFIWKFKNN